MNKTKAKILLSLLVDADLEPTIRKEGIDYFIQVASFNGATSAQIQTLETNQSVTAKIQQVEFN